MIALVLLILISSIAIWFLLSFVFEPLGEFLCKIFNDAMDEINKKEEKEKEKE
jgi:uncharacterized protein involved in cysteine biosynthesis